MDVAQLDRRTIPADARYSFWRGPDGWPLRRFDRPAPSGIPARGSLLFAGGRGDFIEKYLESLGHWHALGWAVTSFDWRGQGDSRGSIVGGHLDSFDPLVTDCAALIAEWVEETPGPHVAIAHSMGGHLLLRTIAERQPKLTAAVLVAPMIGVNATPIPAWLGRLVAATLSRIGWHERRAWKRNERPSPAGSSRQAYLTSSHDRYADELWWKAERPGYDLGPPSWGWMAAAYRSMAKLTPAVLSRIALPVLILGTERDRLVSPTAIGRAAKLMPRAELFMFQNSAHEILRESDPIRLEALARIDAFLDRAAGA